LLVLLLLPGIESVRRFFEDLKPSLKVNIVPIDDPFGPAITDGQINAITCSMETLAGCEQINRIRKEKKLQPLVVVATKRGQSFTLSSTFLRKHQIELKPKL
jgi:pantetheine-phosphate adenylyltransferase